MRSTVGFDFLSGEEFLRSPRSAGSQGFDCTRWGSWVPPWGNQLKGRLLAALQVEGKRRNKRHYSFTKRRKEHACGESLSGSSCHLQPGVSPLLEAGQTAPWQPVRRRTDKERTHSLSPSDPRACLQVTL